MDEAVVDLLNKFGALGVTYTVSADGAAAQVAGSFDQSTLRNLMTALSQTNYSLIVAQGIPLVTTGNQSAVGIIDIHNRPSNTDVATYTV